MGYDAKDRSVVLFGGIDDSGAFRRAPLGDTWTYAGGLWTELYPSPSPAPRFAASLAFDPADGYLVLFGGASTDNWTGSVWNPSPGTSFSDTWTFSGGLWTMLHPLASPTPRWGSNLVYDSPDQYVLLFGGFPDSSGGLGTNETWSFVHGQWTQLNPHTLPPARGLAAMTWDTADRYVVLFGGCSEGACQFDNFNDTWTYAAGSWKVLASKLSPSPRAMAGIADDTADHYVVLFGGAQAIGFALGDTWILAHGQWHRHAASHPPPVRYAGTMTFDAATGQVILLDGCNSENTGCPTNMGSNAGDALGDHWRFVAGDWSPINLFHEPPAGYFPGCGGSITPIGYAASMTYDSADGYVLYFGGPGATWYFAHGQWTLLSPYTSPPSQFYSAMTFDAKDGYIVLFGGFQCGGPFGSTWKFAHGQWANISLSIAPTPRAGAMMTYDPKDGYVVLFGGCGDAGCAGDTWEFVAGHWHPLPTSSPSPIARASGAMAYDAGGQFVLLFGGADGLGCQFTCTLFNDTWSFSAGQWTQLFPHSSPPGRTEAGVAYDGPGVPRGATDGGVVVFGGEVQDVGFSADTWQFSGGLWSLISVPLAPASRSDAAMTYDPATGTILMAGGTSFWTEANSGSAGGFIFPLPGTWEFVP